MYQNFKCQNTNQTKHTYHVMKTKCYSLSLLRNKCAGNSRPTTSTSFTSALCNCVEIFSFQSKRIIPEHSVKGVKICVTSLFNRARKCDLGEKSRKSRGSKGEGAGKRAGCFVVTRCKIYRKHKLNQEHKLNHQNALRRLKQLNL